MDLLWTDKCFLAMLLFCLLMLGRALCFERGRKLFLNLLQQPIAVSAGIVLVFFIGIATIDSIHFKQNEQSNTFSLLDKLLAPLDEVYEKTYSAPFALHLYSAETVFIAGETKQEYSRLSYPPLSIKNSVDKNKLIKNVILRTMLISASMMLLLFLVIKTSRMTMMPKKSLAVGFITLFFCLFLCLSCYFLSRYFHLFGTGKIGQDIFYFTVKSIRTGLILGGLR